MNQPFSAAGQGPDARVAGAKIERIEYRGDGKNLSSSAEGDRPRWTGLPPKQGLYDPAFEHDACGVGFVVDIKGRKSHDILAAGAAGAA